MKGNGILDDCAAAASSFTTFHPHPLNPFAAGRGDVPGQKRSAPDGSSFGATNQFDAHGNEAGNTNTEAAASSSPPAALSPPAKPGGSKRPKKPAPTDSTAGGDGATIEVVRRPRGRPPGSKNKPKPPGVEAAAGENDAGGRSLCSPLRPHIFEVPAGHDITESLAAFSRRRNIGVSVLSATGPVSNVTFRQPHASSPSPGAVIALHGRFDLLSISATFFPPSFGDASPLIPPAAASSVCVSLAGPHGQIFGGAVAGPIVAAGTVTVIAATFGCPSYHRLPLDDELSVSAPGGDTSSEGHNTGGCGPTPDDHHVDQAAPPAAAHHRQEYGHHHPQLPHPQHHHQSVPQPDPVVTSLPLATTHLLSDVIWAPRDRRRLF